MRNKLCTIFYILSILVILLLAGFIIYEKTNIFNNFITKNDLTKQKYRKSYTISTNLDINSIAKDDKTLVVFWATWCGYCIEESEDLNKYINSNPYKSVIVVSHDTDRSELENYLNEKGYNWFVVFDPEKKVRENLEPGSKGIPSSYLLNKNKEIINFHKGRLTTDQLTSFFNEVEI